MITFKTFSVDPLHCVGNQQEAKNLRNLVVTQRIVQDLNTSYDDPT